MKIDLIWGDIRTRSVEVRGCGTWNVSIVDNEIYPVIVRILAAYRELQDSFLELSTLLKLRGWEKESLHTLSLSCAFEKEIHRIKDRLGAE